MTFTPVKLVRGDAERTATTAEEETRLRFDGWVPAPSKKPAAKPSGESTK